MSEPESHEPSQIDQMKPYLIAAGVLFLILVVAFFWPSSETPKVIVSEPIAIETTPQVIASPVDEPEPDDVASQPVPEVYEARPSVQGLEIESGEDLKPLPEIAEAEPLDESDGAVKSAFVTLATSPLFAQYLVDESLLQKFVINVNSIANKEMSPNHSLINAPQNPFRIYQQAERQWIDASSFKRYDSYVSALESVNPVDLVALMNTYRPTLEDKFAEISPPNTSFNRTLHKAIDELLATPEVALPIEVYSDSVMYKFKDDSLEALSGPQKQLLRTGPENTRRIKAVLEKLKVALQD